MIILIIFLDFVMCHSSCFHRLMLILYNGAMFHVVVQAGGQSTRMGRDKGLALFLGEPLVQRVLSRLKGAADEALVVTNRPQAYQFLGVPLREDVLPGRGALGGLFTALTFSFERGGDLAGVVACDMPFANPRILTAARQILMAKCYDAVVPRTAHGAEPFHAVYRPASCLPAVKSALEEGKWRADAWFPDCSIYWMEPDEVSPYDPLRLAFLNVNTPADFQRAEALAREFI